MNFFEQQERTRRRTRWLVVDFALVVLVIVVLVYFALATFVQFIGVPKELTGLAHGVAPELLFSEPWSFFKAVGSWSGFLGVAAVMLLVIGLATLSKTQELARGGSAVGTMLDGRPLAMPLTDPQEQMLHNVVEEMAIASGIPAPEIYVLDGERGINAFAAGHTTGDMVVGVTRGALKTLNREELQGVVAHEFSHILNGDTRLNMRLMGLAFGILCIAVFGRWLVQLTFGLGLDDDDAGGVARVRLGRGWGGVVLAALGVVLLCIGSVGVFFARLIKSAISRQREFLADAAAVQMTRDPLGLAGALKKIGGSPRHARLLCADAESASHLFFGNGLADPWIRWLATHPPLEDRIRALDPAFDGTFPDVALPEPVRFGEVKPEPRPAPKRRGPLQPDQFIAAVGLPNVGHLDHAASLRAALPEPATEAAREPVGAMALVYALLVGPEGDTQSAQLKLLTDNADPAVQPEIQKLLGAITRLDAQARLALIDLAIPALRRISADQYARFMQNVQGLIESDHQIDLFEYTLQKSLGRHLRPYHDSPSPPVVQFYDLKPLLPDAVVVLSALAQMGQDDPAAVEQAFRQGATQLNYSGAPLRLLELKDCNLPQIDAALNRLAQATPMIRKNVLYSCAHTVAADGQVQDREAELLRAIADALDCPVPPFFAAGGHL